MRILFISNFYPPNDLGGMEQLCEELVSRLRKRGHDCHVLTSNYGVENQSLIEDQVLRRLHLEADIHYYRPQDFFLRRSGREDANRQSLQSVVERFRPDIVFIWGMWDLSPQVAYWAERLMPGRVAYFVASYWLMEPTAHEAYWQKERGRPLARALLAPVRRTALRSLAQERNEYPLALGEVACVSEFVRRKLSEAGTLPHGARVIYNGVDPEPFLEAAAQSVPSSDQLRLVYIGSILQHKGVHTAVEALGLLKQHGDDRGLHLTLVGGGHPEYETRLRQRVDELGLYEYVTFYGRVPREEIPHLLAGFDVFLFTSIWEEPIARTVMEAMAAGLAVIGTDVGGQSEMLVNGVNALTFPPDDATMLAACIMQLKCDPVLCSRLADAGQQMVLERFTLDRMTDELDLWLREVLYGAGSTRKA